VGQPARLPSHQPSTPGLAISANPVTSQSSTPSSGSQKQTNPPPPVGQPARLPPLSLPHRHLRSQQTPSLPNHRRHPVAPKSRLTRPPPRGATGSVAPAQPSAPALAISANPVTSQSSTPSTGSQKQTNPPAPPWGNRLGCPRFSPRHRVLQSQQTPSLPDRLQQPLDRPALNRPLQRLVPRRLHLRPRHLPTRSHIKRQPSRRLV
jgi:hypothetical protein